MKKTPFLFSFFFLLLCSCEGDMDIYFAWTGLDALNSDNSGTIPEPTHALEMPAKAYTLRLELYPVETKPRRGRYVDAETPPHNTNEVDSILVTSTANFSPAYPAGTPLNDLFVIFNGDYTRTRSINDFYVMNTARSDFGKNPLPAYADLLLMEQPDSARTFRFIVMIRLLDGTVFRDTTSSIKLIPG